MATTDSDLPIATPTVSIVMPAYNHERFIGEAIESVLQQSFTDLELVIIDDGSTDGTAGVIGSYDDPRVRYHHQQNQDAYNSLNRGLSLASGQYISIINSDDVYTLNRIERLLDHARSNGKQCIFSDVTPIDANSEPLAELNHPWNLWHRGNREYFLQTGDLYDGFLHGNFMVTTSNLFFSAEVRTTVGDFAALRYLHDYDYIFRILLAFESQVEYLDNEKLLHYRLHGDNTISEAAITGREQDQHVIRKYLKAKFSAGDHSYIDTAVNRLIALEHELLEARRSMEPSTAALDQSQPAPTGVAKTLRSLFGPK